MLPALLGKSLGGRQMMLEEAFTLALRNGNWKYIAPQSKGTPLWLKDKKVATGLETQPQLFDLSNDIHEENNLIDKRTNVAAKMKRMLQDIEKTPTRAGYKK